MNATDEDGVVTLANILVLVANDGEAAEGVSRRSGYSRGDNGCAAFAVSVDIFVNERQRADDGVAVKVDGAYSVASLPLTFELPGT